MDEARRVLADLFVRASATFAEADTVLAAFRRLTALEAALHALVGGTDPAVSAAEFVDVVREGAAIYCFYCDEESTVGTMRPLSHAPDCPWAMARALLAEKGEG